MIPQSKTGDCSFCPAKNTSVVKRGKDYYCQRCKDSADSKKSIKKAADRQVNRHSNPGRGFNDDSLSELELDLDRVISRYVRLRDMEHDGTICCFICGKHVRWENAHAMHYIGRANKTTRFLLENIKSGDYDCNVALDGNLEKYAEKLEEEHSGIIDFLIEESKKVSRATVYDLKQLLTEFQFKLKLVETKIR